MEPIPAIKIKSLIHISNIETAPQSSQTKAIEAKKTVWSHERCHKAYDLSEHSVFYRDQWFGEWTFSILNEKI